MRAKCIGWVRDRKGRVIKRPFKDICNCLTTFAGGGHATPGTGMGNTTPYVAVVKEN